VRIIPVAFTQFIPWEAEESGYEPHDWGSDEFDDLTSADELAEFAGRNCYQSWSRPNPKTATNEGYLANILDQGHYSVLEHASVSFFVDGVSRSLLTELERHRFLSFSVVAVSFVKYDKTPSVAVPPLIEREKDTPLHGQDFSGMGWTIGDEFMRATENSFDAYVWIADRFQELGYPKKQALEAARSVLPNATEVKMVVTGNIRAWRDVIGKRYHEAADAEIREFATEVLNHLRELSPNSVQDISEVPYGK